MIIQHAYLTMFQILNNYYFQEKKNDSLASLLSDMDPNIFSDGKAADPATYNDWYNAVKPYVKNGKIKNEDINLALKNFLIYYQQEFGFDFEDVIMYINNYSTNN